MRWRKFQAEDYDVVAPWFLEHGWPVAPELSFLPPTGFIVEDEHGPAGVGFLYLSNCPTLAFLDWLATRPNLGLKGFKVLKFLLESLTEAAVGVGVSRIVHLSKPKYENVFERKFGFKKAETLSMLVWRAEDHGSY